MNADILSYIVLPAIAVIATLVVLGAVWAWQDFGCSRKNNY